ncbi:alkaline phosphatase PhoX [Pelagicoccus albus]|uniref:DUF839 domain-containing protein n=1 Tax=Pelagicoccus albus TaxID=415222 RepID=A0A7X1B9E2_9BACT|nr:alkaline phosphatase PhoX [Pelagicoccus albus]MBC2607764.1 DUF839 domain-containing protein [Pelagicoccus albus]
MKPNSRREFIKNTALSLGFIGLQVYVTGCAKGSGSAKARVGYGPLTGGPDELLKLPKGFSYTSFSKTGELMDDGLAVPGDHDGMAAFPLDEDRVILVRNHELDPNEQAKSPFFGNREKIPQYLEKQYDPAHGSGDCCGGTTTLIYNLKTQSLEQHSLSLAGTIRNCSGGPTPWGTWLTCEEDVSKAGETLEKDHGYVFEVPATAEIGLALPVPIKPMGRFYREAVAVAPETGIVYQTEDRLDSLIYRYIPNTPGKLHNGGRTQALAIVGKPSSDTRNWPDVEAEQFPINSEVSVEWIDMEDIDNPEDDLRRRGFEAGAARFARGEGIFYIDGSVYFACTNGGAKQYGQIFKYTPSPLEGTEREAEAPGKLELYIESHDKELMQACDNMTVAPWGDIIICEDCGLESSIVGITPEGEIYHIAHAIIDSEFAGCTFSPDGSTLFVNIQSNPGQTLAITGPWREDAS